ncbi:MAG: hypothetical protein AAB497_03995 [Patescibacteria group bacterium]
MKRLTGNESYRATGYTKSEGHAIQITLPNGKFWYTGVGSGAAASAARHGMECKVVGYYGACIYININDRAHDGFPIEIDGIEVSTFLDKIATDQEVRKFSF